MTLDDFRPGMRVRWSGIDVHRGKSGHETTLGTVSHVSPPSGAGVVWVQWDHTLRGTLHPVQPDNLMRETARGLTLC